MPIDWSDRIVIVELADEPTLSEELVNIFERLRDAKATPDLVLNFDGVTYLSSSHIAQLLKLRKLVADRSRSLVLCALDENVWSVMLLTGLDRVFRVVPDMPTALTTLQLERAGGAEG